MYEKYLKKTSIAFILLREFWLAVKTGVVMENLAVSRMYIFNCLK